MRYFLGWKNLSRIFILLIIQNFAFSKTPTIKVRIAKAQRKISLAGLDLKNELRQLGKRKEYLGNKTLNFNCSQYAKKISKKPLLVASLKSPSGMISWNSQKYTGELNVLTTKDYKGCDLVNVVKMDTYISMLLPKEMSSDWPIEALKAQAVAARTYAYHKIKSDEVSKLEGHETHYDLENSEKHQVNGSFSDVTRSTAKASKSTSGEVLSSHSGEITPIFFHSKCGGKTMLPQKVWTNKVSGYQSVDCPFCHKRGTPSWKKNVTSYKLKKKIKSVLKSYHNHRASSSSLRILKDHKSRDHLRVYSNDKAFKVPKSKLRFVMGRKTLPSNYFKIEQKNGKIELKGSGNGHGVGLCQFGALELAKRGYTYKQILSHYFPGHRIKKIY